MEYQYLDLVMWQEKDGYWVVRRFGEHGILYWHSEKKEAWAWVLKNAKEQS